MSYAPTTLPYPAPPGLARIQRRSLVIGVVFLAAAAIAAVVGHSPTQFFRSYLLGYVWWTGLTRGCLAVLMMQHPRRFVPQDKVHAHLASQDL